MCACVSSACVYAIEACVCVCVCVCVCACVFGVFVCVYVFVRSVRVCVRSVCVIGVC